MTKEDDVSKISTSVFVTSFPDSFTAKDLFHTCKIYGHVVDSFIPSKRSREGITLLLPVRELVLRVKEVTSLTNLKKALINEGFDDLTMRYMGELWVLLEFNSVKSKDLFSENIGVGSWFLELKQASNDFLTEGRIIWVEVEGVPLKVWSVNTFKKIAAKWGELLDIDDEEDIYLHSKRL
ncbi:nucleotide-binding alpha-beta plait domain-containing protein, partial [Tanacetum coccineum]